MIKTKNLLCLLFTISSSVLFAQYENNDKGKIESIFASTKIKFIGGSMVPTQESMTVLSKIAKSLNAFPDYKYRITGYARSRGDLTHNQILSKNRASQVKNILISQGMDASQLTTKGVVGIKAKKKQAKKRKVLLSYIDFELIDKTNKRSVKNNAHTTSISASYKKKNETDTQIEPKKTLEEYLILRSKMSAIKQEKEKILKHNKLQEKTKLQRAGINNQKSKSRINVFFSMNQISFNENSTVLDDKAKRVLYKTAEFMLSTQISDTILLGILTKVIKKNKIFY